MGRTLHGRAGTLQEALSEAVGALLDAEDVVVSVEGEAAAGWSGTVRLELEVSPVAEVEDQIEDEVPPSDAVEMRPAQPRESWDDDEGPGDAADAVTEGLSEEELDAEADAAADFLEGLLDAMDLPGDLRLKLHADHVELEIVDVGSGALIGRRGQTLDAIQELARCSLQREFQRRARVKIDVEGYRARRLEKLLEKADEAIDAVLDTGEPERLEPMDVFERKAVHQMVADVDGLASRSQGREPARRVIIELD